MSLQVECGGPPIIPSTPLKVTHNGPTMIGGHHHSPQQQQQMQQRNNARERAMHAVEYYNSNVLRARVGAGLAGPRSSVNERHNYNPRPVGINMGNKLYPNNSENLYRSNSSLELIHDHGSNQHDNIMHGGTNLRREYGSHGSIDIISSDRNERLVNGQQPSTGESFLAMLQEYKPAVFGLENRSQINNHHHVGKILTTEDSVDRGSTSPKLRNKLNRLWHQSGPKQSRSVSHVPSLEDTSGSTSAVNTSIISTNSNISTTSSTTTVSSADIEERQRRRAFAHYDCQSLTANLGYAAKLRGVLLARRRNTTTGASAAAMYGTRSSTPDGDSVDEDFGDGQNNELLENCPFFRNEIGGEEEREVSLTRMQPQTLPGQQKRAIHRPSLAYGVSVLECGPNESLWKQITCPYQKGQRPIEQIDNGARYYRQYFLGQEHQNWFGMDEQLGPVAISIKKEKLPTQANQITSSDALHQNQQHLYRLIVRTSELLTLRGSVVEDSIPNPKGAGKQASTKEILEYVAPEVQIGCLRLGVNSPQCEQQLLKLDEQGLTNKYKVGILYCRSGQSTEEDMYNNEEAGPAFNEFLDTIGKRVRLKGFEHYKAGLDNKTDSTGTHSLYAQYQDCEVMFHVSTMLPFTPNNRQQLLRKRHIGNDIVTIVFQEPGALPFSPKNIRSQFQHVFIIVRAVNPCSENTHYRVAVSRSKEVPVFGPPVRAGSFYQRNKYFSDFLLSKVINAENAAHRSEKFATMATRTRQEYLKDLTTNYCSATMVDTGQKFSIFPSKKRERSKPRFSGDLTQRGAFCWQVVLHDSGLSSQVDCFLGISAETFVLIEECTRQIIFVTPCKSILGWSTSGNSLRVYHHQGECVTLNMRDSGDRDEQLEVIERLRAVTNGCGALELSLRRNPMGQLGFHVQPDGVVTQVEMSGQAWTAGLRQGYRLVEICKVAVATLSHDQMVDLLKTSAQVTVTVIESFSDYSPRRGCFLQNCRFNSMNYESDYESFEPRNEKSAKKTVTPAQLQQPVNHRRRYERNFSPPRSSNSSGYGTGSSSRSFNNMQANDHRYVHDMGTLTSSSSGHSSNDERWYDVLEMPSQETAPVPQEPTPNGNYHPKLTSSSNSLPLASAAPRPLSLHNDSRQTANSHSANVALLKRLIINDGAAEPNEPIYNSTKNISPTNQLVEEQNLSKNNSPQLRRSATTTNIYGLNGKKAVNGTTTVSSSASSSRNNSPRPNGEAKLRANRTANVNMAQRNSVNYTGSTLQEDLMKLINPDYIAGASDDNFHNGPLEKVMKNHPNSHSLGNISSVANSLKAVPPLAGEDLILLKKTSRSREGINLSGINGVPPSATKLMKSNSTVNGDVDSNTSSEVIFTTARPATVISSTTSNSSSPSSELNNNKLHINEDHLKVSPRKQNGGILKNPLILNGSNKIPLPDMKEMDWSSLVDTATKAITQINETASKTVYYDDMNSVLNGIEQNGTTTPTISDTPTPSSASPVSNSSSNSSNNLATNNGLGMQSSSSLPELQTQVTQLSDRVLREQRRRRSLEHAVRRLTEENRRLQDESQAAVQQLKRFTEWFFQTIDRQS